MSEVLFVTPDGYAFGNLDGYPTSCLVGRNDWSDLRSLSVKVSRPHCMLWVTQQGELKVRDLESTNGTWLNGTQLKSPEATVTTEDLVGLAGDSICMRLKAYPPGKKMQAYRILFGTPEQIEAQEQIVDSAFPVADSAAVDGTAKDA